MNFFSGSVSHQIPKLKTNSNDTATLFLSGSVNHQIPTLKTIHSSPTLPPHNLKLLQFVKQGFLSDHYLLPTTLCPYWKHEDLCWEEDLIL
ncbi:hypothetical protein E2C01_043420 [Portunus trituberculatus]|uniref:Uncharacterized protein n=1 Tax=Portunus trituberculatus TaxID=210409 RepID=A0A5B7FSX8_PORTR|nr:hypothetical protein [Portunus trituberculatus]